MATPVKSLGWNLLLVGVGRNTDEAGAADAFDQYGLMVQGGVFVIPNRAELFARYELIELDGVFSPTAAAIDDQLHIVTLGMNWFYFAHNLKLTTDVMYLFNEIPAGNTFVGLLASDDGPQWVLRTGLSLMF
ncbi:hypothetical protein [Fontivita pretiosa]|uniref:hypothetical protein n=1 Tax=Fontivita pretiosa TaxID=2989684 RepID=UPI003D169D0B